jgi:hypothetical protein
MVRSPRKPRCHGSMAPPLITASNMESDGAEAGVVEAVAGCVAAAAAGGELPEARCVWGCAGGTGGAWYTEDSGNSSRCLAPTSVRKLCHQVDRGLEGDAGAGGRGRGAAGTSWVVAAVWPGGFGAAGACAAARAAVTAATLAAAASMRRATWSASTVRVEVATGTPLGASTPPSCRGAPRFAIFRNTVSPFL